jgi:putative sugar O-methyltransferase
MVSRFAGRLWSRIKWETHTRWLIWLKSREFSRDLDYSLQSMPKGLLDRAYEPDFREETAILKRIISSYNKAKAIQRKCPAVYQVSNEWRLIYEMHLSGAIRALESSNVEELRRIYRHFYRDKCSTGLHGLPTDMQKHYFGGRIQRVYRRLYLNDAFHRLRLWETYLGSTHTLADLATPEVGNPYGHYVKGIFITCGSDYKHYYATRIARLVREVDHAVVLELGGGFGGMGYYLIRDNSALTYVDFDLPENMALTAYYLLSAFPREDILLFGESDLTTQSLRQYRMVVMPNFEIERLEAKSVDLAFNSYSLAEMSPETIHHYVGECDRTVKQYFLHINHNTHSELRADDFGVNPKHFQLLSKTPALWNAGKPWDWDEYEYLYRRIPSGVTTAGVERSPADGRLHS